VDVAEVVASRRPEEDSMLTQASLAFARLPDAVRTVAQERALDRASVAYDQALRLLEGDGSS
jgi:hypothetical protein